MKKKKIQIPTQAPEGYFETLPDVIWERVKGLPLEAAQSPKAQLKISPLWASIGSIAATFLLLVSLWTLRPVEGNGGALAVEAQLAKIPTESIAHYLAQDEDLTALEVGRYLPAGTELYFANAPISTEWLDSETVELLLEDY